MLDFLGNLRRTHYCGELRASDAGCGAVVMGWVHRRRDLGNLLFLDVRDRSGIVQVVFNKETQSEAHAKAEQARSEFVVAVEGNVTKREKANPDIATGEVELVATAAHRDFYIGVGTPFAVDAVWFYAHSTFFPKLLVVRVRQGEVPSRARGAHPEDQAILE